MQTRIEGEITLLFLGAGVGKKSGETWVRMSNGEEAFFFSTELDVSEFDGHERGDNITVNVDVDVFSDYSRKVLEVVS